MIKNFALLLTGLFKLNLLCILRVISYLPLNIRYCHCRHNLADRVSYLSEKTKCCGKKFKVDT